MTILTQDTTGLAAPFERVPLSAPKISSDFTTVVLWCAVGLLLSGLAIMLQDYAGVVNALPFE